MFVIKKIRGFAGAALVAGCAALALGASAVGAETIDQVKEKGELTIGMLVDFPPYGIMNTDNKPDGYDADVARLRAKGYQFLSDAPSPGAHGCRVIFIHPKSCDGVLIELSQPGDEQH